MVGMGMIFDETYRPFFEQVRATGLYERSFGTIEVPLAAVASRTGQRADAFLRAGGAATAGVKNFFGARAVESLLTAGVDFVCIATPDDRHFEAARLALEAGIPVLIEKPSVLSLSQLDELQAIARRKQ